MLTKRQYEILKAVTTESDIFEQSDCHDIDFLISRGFMKGVPCARDFGVFPYQVSDSTSNVLEEYEQMIKQEKREKNNTKSNIISTIISGMALLVSAVALIISCLGRV